MTTPYSRFVSLALLLLGSIFAALPAHAQPGRCVKRPPGELLAAFVREHRTPPGESPGPSWEVSQVLAYPETYPRADLQIFLQGLEQLALTGDSPRLRAAAALSLSLPGSRRKPNPVRGTAGRLARIYRQASDPHVRGVIVSAMADLAERTEALAFLERIATQSPEEADFPGAASMSLGTLVAMDTEGRAVLRRLHETGAVRDPEARHSLAVLASREYRIN